jgi:hypothetical protein
MEQLNPACRRGEPVEASRAISYVPIDTRRLLPSRDAAGELRDQTSILTFTSCRHGTNRKAVSEGDEVARNCWDTGARQDHTDKIQWIAGRERDFCHARRSATLPDRTKRLYGLRQGKLLSDEPADEPPASHLAGHLHPPIPNEEITPRPNQ